MPLDLVCWARSICQGRPSLSAAPAGIQLRGPELSEGLVSCNFRVGRPSEILGFESRMLAMRASIRGPTSSLS
jgi:hypothetical protein